MMCFVHCYIFVYVHVYFQCFVLNAFSLLKIIAYSCPLSIFLLTFLRAHYM